LKFTIPTRTNNFKKELFPDHGPLYNKTISTKTLIQQDPKKHQDKSIK